MNQRTKKIISILNQADEAVRISELAEQFQVTQRTIRNDLNEINTILRQNRMKKLSFKSGGLVMLPDGFSDLIPLLESGDFYTYKLSKEERKQVAAAMLVGFARYVTLSEMADSLFVSRATLINDLDDIKTFIQESGLKVHSYPNKGLLVEGKESVKRFFLLNLALPFDGKPEQQNVAAQHISVQAGNRVIIQKILSEQEAQYDSYLVDSSYRMILTYLGIMLNRNLQGEFVEPCAYISSDKYRMAQDILKYITQYCSITTTEDEIRMLTILLERSRYMHKQHTRKNSVKIQALSRRFIASISEEIGINLNGDYDFFENLSNHLESVFSAPPVDYPEQAIIDEVLEDNQDILEAVKNKLPIIQPFIHRTVTETELSYIAIHVCAAIERRKNQEVAIRVVVACHAGIGTSQLLLERLKQHFNLQIVDVVSAHGVSKLSKGDADFVISTIPLKGCPLDYVVVSPSLNDNEYIRVGNKIDALRNSRNLPSRVEKKERNAKALIDRIKPEVYEMVPETAPELMKKLRRVIRDYFDQSAEAEAEIFSPYLHHLLPASNIELDVECADWRDAIRRSVQPLVERGYIESRYIDAMIANMEENGPYIVLSKGFAVPHEGLEQGSIKVGMYLIRLKTPVPFGADELDLVEFVCCLSAVDHKTHLKSFFNLVNMLRDNEFKQLLHDCNTPEEAAAIIEKYEYGTMG